MTQLSPPETPAPSWTLPIVTGMVATVLLHLATLFSDNGWVVVCFCGCGSGLMTGFFPALVAFRRDRNMRAGAGFAVAFIGVGLGAVVLAVAAIAQGWQLSEEFVEAFRESALEDVGSEPNWTAEDAAASVALLREIGRFFPVLGAAIVALFGGVGGAITVAIGRRMRPPRTHYYQPDDRSWYGHHDSEERFEEPEDPRESDEPEPR